MYIVCVWRTFYERVRRKNRSRNRVTTRVFTSVQNNNKILLRRERGSLGRRTGRKSAAMCPGRVRQCGVLNPYYIAAVRNASCRNNDLLRVQSRNMFCLSKISLLKFANPRAGTMYYSCTRGGRL